MDNLERKLNERSLDHAQKSELGEVAKEFGEGKPSNTNFISKDQFTLWWRGRSQLKKLSPKSVQILDDYADALRSVGGWNTEKKVEAFTGIQKTRTGFWDGLKERLLTKKER